MVVPHPPEHLLVIIKRPLTRRTRIRLPRSLPYHRVVDCLTGVCRTYTQQLSSGGSLTPLPLDCASGEYGVKLIFVPRWLTEMDYVSIADASVSMRVTRCWLLLWHSANCNKRSGTVACIMILRWTEAPNVKH